MNSVGILGYGRFGQVLAKLLRPDYEVNVFDPKLSESNDVQCVSKEALLNETTLFIAVPINQFESVIQSIAPHLKDDTTIFDVCSIKLHPVKVMQQYLPKQVGIVATHPLFGPDSIDLKEQLNFMMHPVRDTHHCYEHWKTFFANKGFNIVEMTPDEHDRYAAKSQGVVHFVSRFLDEANLSETPIDTAGFRQLLKLVKNNCHDTWELFSDLQKYNPYSKEMIEALETAFKTVKSKL